MPKNSSSSRLLLEVYQKQFVIKSGNQATFRAVIRRYTHKEIPRHEERPPSLPEPSAIMNAPHLSQVAVHTELSTLDTAKSPGPDQLHPFMLRILADFLAEHISTLFNNSLQI